MACPGEWLLWSPSDCLLYIDQDDWPEQLARLESRLTDMGLIS